MKKSIYCFLAFLVLFSCKKEDKQSPGSKPPVSGGTTDSIQPNSFKAPLYWSPYEYNITTDGYIPEDVWSKNIDWVEQNLKSYGYTMVCIDGWGDDAKFNQYGYRTTHSSNWTHDYEWWSKNLQARGMTLGIYNNPLWIIKSAADAGVKIKGTNIPLASIMNEAENATWFKWVQVDKPGAEEYVKGYIQYYADMGVKYLRVDFLSWFETGYDRNVGTVGPNRTKEQYEKALKWMREACDRYGIFLSLVMPNLNNEAALEQKYGHMIRINEDAGDGKWAKWSDWARGERRQGWSQYANAMDGLTYWSYITGKGKMILDPDFLRLNTFSNDDEKKSVVSACLVSGAPVTVSDQYNTIGSNLWVYQNEEMLALNKEGFVGKPLSNDPTNELSQTWKGQLANGDRIVAFFNRETTARNRSINFPDLGISSGLVRDIWKHQDLGGMTSFSASVPPHGCVVVKIVAGTISQAAAPMFNIAEGNYNSPQSISISTATTGATIYYTTDGTAPTISSAVYSTPINISATTTIKAFAVKTGLNISSISSALYTIRTSSLPAPWSGMDVGAASPAGYRNYAGATSAFTNEGAGADIEGSADAFSYIYQQVSGDVAITAKITALTNTNAWAKAGVMIRESLNANAGNAFLAITPSNGVSFQKRMTTGGSTTATIVGSLAVPYWLRLKREGNNFSAFSSPDGTNWTQVGTTVPIAMNATVYVGLPVTSHSEGTLATATFTNVSIQ